MAASGGAEMCLVLTPRRPDVARHPAPPMMKKALATSLLVLASVGCDSLGPVEFDSLSHDPVALVGTWDLVGQWSYWTGSREVEDPREAGWNEAWTFSADGTVEVAVDSENYDRTVTSSYEVVAEPGRTPYLRVGDQVVGGDGGYLFGVDGDRLILLDRLVADAPERVYHRRD